jgi:acyl-CoA synthetase (AMP-forming)/AMP-acid ligase II
MKEGLQRGGRVVIIFPNSPELVTAFFATAASGGIAVPLDIYAKREEIIRMIDFVEPVMVLASPGLMRKIKTDIEKRTKAYILTLDEGKLIISGAGSEPLSICGHAEIQTENVSSGGDGAGFPPLVPSDDAVFIMTSGTSGAPKAVRLSHGAVIKNIQMHLESLEIPHGVTAMQVLSMNYSYGLIASFLATMYNHGTVVLMPRLEAGAVCQCIDRFEVDLFMGTPTIFQYIFENVKSEYCRKLRRLRCITLGGDRCKPYVANLIARNLPDVQTFITYGLTEAGPRVATLRPEYFPTLCHSVGPPMPGVEVCIVRENGEACSHHEVGEIAVKTPSLMNGYFRNDEETQKRLHGGWCYTGDLGSMDERGFIYIAGRKDRLFKLQERTVNPAFIEHCIAGHPNVREVIVTKVGKDREEYLCATIEGNDVPEDRFIWELKKICSQSMPFFMIPREFKFNDAGDYYFKGKPAKSLPKTGTARTDH